MWVLKDGRRQAWRLTLPRPRSKVGDGRQFIRSAVTLEGKPIRFRPTPDEHIRIGRPFFDVLRGEYVIEPPPNGKTRLHLLSQHRVSTDFELVRTVLDRRSDVRCAGNHSDGYPKAVRSA